MCSSEIDSNFIIVILKTIRLFINLKINFKDNFKDKF